mgnify:CR=1 FL=1
MFPSLLLTTKRSKMFRDILRHYPAYKRQNKYDIQILDWIAVILVVKL